MVVAVVLGLSLLLGPIVSGLQAMSSRQNGGFVVPDHKSAQRPVWLGPSSNKHV